MIAELVLPPPRPQGGADGADQDGNRRGPLQHGDVAELLHGPCHCGRTGSAAGQHQHRQVGPGRLLAEPCGQTAVAAVDRFFGDQYRACACCQLRADLHLIGAANARNAGARKDRVRQLPVLDRGGQDQHAGLQALMVSIVHGLSLAPSLSSSFSWIGTPVSTPQNSRRGGPM